jgi:calcineurin-like phosphoesterase family protein/2'-5' RNA ligase
MLIELRVCHEKEKIQGWAHAVCADSGLYIRHLIPHLTLYGEFQASPSSYRKIQQAIVETASKYDSLPFLIDGYELFQGPHGFVFAFKIVPSQQLEDFRLELSKKMRRIAQSPKPWDYKDEFKFHLTVAYRLGGHHADKIRRYIAEHGEHPYLPADGIRVTLLNDNRKIICEYDLLQKMMLDRSSALDGGTFARTLYSLRRIKCMHTVLSHSAEPTTYLFSDSHFGHANIIRYCARPFYNVREMNEVLLSNWNNIVSDKDKVYFLGDLVHGVDCSYWASKLNGDITFIAGNHDPPSAKRQMIATFGGQEFLLVHSPYDACGWNGWVIHGHVHNNRIYDYPFINGETRTINISAELLDYKPFDIRELLSLNIDTIKRMDTVSSVPVRWDGHVPERKNVYARPISPQSSYEMRLWERVVLKIKTVFTHD